MSSKKMRQVLESLAYVTGQKPLIDVSKKKKMAEETVAAMTGPIAKPFAPEVRRTFPGAKEEIASTEIPSDGKPAGNPPVGSGEPQAGGDPSYYAKETSKPGYPPAPGAEMAESMLALAKKLTQEAEELIGKSLVGGPEQQKGGDPEHYQGEKEAPKAELKEGDEKPEGKPVIGEPKDAKVDEPSQYAGEKEAPKPEIGEVNKASKLVKEAEELLSKAPESASGGDSSCYGKEAEAPKAELKEADEEKPQKEHEIYATSDDLEAISSRALGAVQSMVVNPRSTLCLKFNADDAAKDQAIEALRNAGFTVVGEEVEKTKTESCHDEAAVVEAFSRGHYEAIAEILKKSSTVKEVVDSLITLFKADNPRFDSERFLDAVRK